MLADLWDDADGDRLFVWGAVGLVCIALRIVVLPEHDRLTQMQREIAAMDSALDADAARFRAMRDSLAALRP